jgi:hypothetical protein
MSELAHELPGGLLIGRAIAAAIWHIASKPGRTVPRDHHHGAQAHR